MATKIYPTVRIENVGPAQTNAPFTFGQVFAPGHILPTDGLHGYVDEKTSIPLQVDVKALHGDGSVRHAVVSGFMPSIGDREIITLPLSARPGVSVNPVNVFKRGPTPSVDVTIAGLVYVATMPHDGGIVLLDGPIANEFQVMAPLVSETGPHPHLMARFGVRSYGHAFRVEIGIENNKTFAAGAQNFTYDVTLNAGNGQKTLPTITHYHHSRWRHVEWIGCNELIPHPDTAYLIATRAIPNYDLTIKPSEKAITDWVARNVNASGPMKIGPVNPAMPATGGRPDIAPLPGWTVCYLLSHDKRMRDVMMSAAEGSASWPIHYRDEKTTYPVRLDQYPTFSTHMNMGGPPLPMPRTVAGQSAVPYQPDTAHQPSFTYLPYLITGDYFYLEELHFWAAWNPTQTDPANHGKGQGLVKWQQIRGQAWSLRTLGHAAYITPDTHPLKSYFTKQVENNIAFYHQTYVVGQPNKLGFYDGSGAGSFPIGGPPAGTLISPFQDAYFTWAIGNLVTLGFESARPLAHWKGQFIVNLLTSADFPWMNAADFSLRARMLASDPWPQTTGELFRMAYGRGLPDDNRKLLVHPEGKPYLEQPLDPQSQADWITAASGRRWPVGRMLGYADYEMGYPANMQPALAMLVDLGVKGADKAWAQYEQRASKPDYARGPQFAIVPRKPDPIEKPQPKINARVQLEIAIQSYAESTEESKHDAAGAAMGSLNTLLEQERAIVQGAKK